MRPRVMPETGRPFVKPSPVSRATSHETMAPFAPLRGAGVERTGLNVFALPGCVLAVFVGGNHGQVFQHLDEANLFYSTALAVIGSTMFCFKSAKWLTAPSGQHYSASAVASMLC
jgi:hypothetical protein